MARGHGRCHIEGMTEKRPKRARDPNQLAKLIVDIATGDVDDTDSRDKAAVARGVKGGPARAKKLSQEQRSEIARIAAAARWKKAKS